MQPSRNRGAPQRKGIGALSTVESPTFRLTRRNSDAAVRLRRIPYSPAHQGQGHQGQGRSTHSALYSACRGQRLVRRLQIPLRSLGVRAVTPFTPTPSTKFIGWQSCNGALNVMNARRLHHLKACGAFDAHEIARQDVLADIVII